MAGAGLTRGWVVLAVVVFAGVLLLRPPLRALLWVLPAAVHCEQASGSLWQGRCGQAWVQRPGLPEQIKVRVSWRLLPLQLLRGRLAAELQLTRGGSAVEVLVQRTFGTLELSALRGTVLLEDQLLPGVPQGWQGRGTLEDLRLRWHGGVLDALQGRVRLAGLRSLTAQPVDYGSLVLSWPRAPGAALQPATIADEGGPLAVQATLAVQPSGAWQLDGSVTPRPSASPALLSQLQLLGPAATDGRWILSIAGRP